MKTHWAVARARSAPRRRRRVTDLAKRATALTHWAFGVAAHGARLKPGAPCLRPRGDEEGEREREREREEEKKERARPRSAFISVMLYWVVRCASKT